MTLWDGLLGFGVVMGVAYIVVAGVIKKNPEGVIAQFMKDLKEEKEKSKQKIGGPKEYTQQLYPERRNAI